MNSGREARRKLLTLAGEVCDGAAVPARVAELEQLLWADAEHRRDYLRYVFTHVELACSDGVLRAIAAPEARGFVRPRPTTGSKIGPGVLRWAAAALVVLGTVAGVSMLVNLERSQRLRSVEKVQPVAVVSDVAGAVWEGRAPGAGEPLNPGFIRLRSGSAQVEFYSGATVRLQGPCEFGLNSASRGFLRSGRLTAHVSPRAHGFTIAAPGIAVVDLGTEFGMKVEANGDAQVQVLRGHVELHVGDERSPGRRLSESQAVAVERGRARSIAFNPAEFDAVKIAAASLLTNGGFEVTVPWTRADYAYAPSGSDVGWVFEGREGAAGSGVIDSGSLPWGGTKSVEGRQHAFLIRASAFSQELRGLIPGGRYRLSWADAMRVYRGAGPNELRVELIDSDGTARTLFKAMVSDAKWSRHQAEFTAPPGLCTLRFRTTNPLGGRDRAVFIDDVQLSKIVR